MIIPMKKILVLGRGGSGKTTFSKQLGKILGYKTTHLDDLFWRPNWVRAYTAKEWGEKIKELLAEDEWILDGNYHNTLEMRLASADTVIFFKINPFVALYRALKRRFFSKASTGDNANNLHQEGKIWMAAKTIFSFPY